METRELNFRFLGYPDILLSTIDGNVVFVHSQLYSYITSVNSVLCPTKLTIIVILLE